MYRYFILIIIIFGTSCSNNTESNNSSDLNFNLDNSLGLYSGSYNGNENGNWNLAIYPNGNISGLAENVNIQGRIDQEGFFKVSSIEGFTMTGEVIDEKINGHWSREDNSGNIDGTRYSQFSDDFIGNNSNISSQSSLDLSTCRVNCTEDVGNPNIHCDPNFEVSCDNDQPSTHSFYGTDQNCEFIQNNTGELISYECNSTMRHPSGVTLNSKSITNAKTCALFVFVEGIGSCFSH